MNKYLMDFYDEYYTTKSITSLEDFTKKTFPQDGTDRLFIGCTLILITSVYKTRVTAEALSKIVASVFEKVGSTNLLNFYYKRVNTNKMVSKYLKKIINDKNLEKYARTILDFLEDMSFDFINYVSTHQDKLSKYIESDYKNENI